MIRDRQPTVAEIINELESPTDKIGFCRQIRDGRFYAWVEPHEIYIEALGTWLRCDGSHAGFALNGMRDFGRDSRRQLRAAVDRWVLRRAQALDRLAMECEKDENLMRVVCCNGTDCGCQAATAGSYVKYLIEGVLK